MAKDPYRFFRIEARELLDQLSSGVIALEGRTAEAEVLAKLLRLAHTLKGAARVVKQAEFADGAHVMEGELAPYRDGGMIIPPEAVSRVLAQLDVMNNTLARLPGTDNELATPVPVPRQARTDLAEVGELLDGLGEIGRELAWMRDLGITIGHVHERVAELTEQLVAPRANPTSAAVHRASVAKAHALAEEIGGLLVGVERNMSSGVERIERELRQARDTTERLRLVPAASLFSTLERTARDAAQSAGKQVNFETGGGEVLLDGQVLDLVQNALVQLVRNAVAHGLEGEAERRANGKPPAGHVHLQVARHGYRVSFCCTDDGRGIDFDAVRTSAQRQGSLPPGKPPADEQTLLNLLLKGGISTSGTVTQLSGRGIGLDVVREAAHRLHGELRADTAARRGTAVELTVPVSLAAVNTLLVEVDGQVVAIPLEAVRRTERLAREDIVQTPSGAAIPHQGQLIALIFPRLNGRSASTTTRLARSAVIIQTGATVTAVAVDHLLGTETIVLGTYLDNEGSPRLVLDPVVLANTQAEALSVALPGPGSINPILIVDDSLTTRMLEQSILEAAGLPVETAASAEEALERVRHRRYALFLVDVEMPGMDGYTFIATIRADPSQNGIPCILVTSCDSAEDRRRGEAAGAVAHIVKSQFDQVDFLRRIHALVQV